MAKLQKSGGLLRTRVRRCECSLVGALARAAVSGITFLGTPETRIRIMISEIWCKLNMFINKLFLLALSFLNVDSLQFGTKIKKSVDRRDALSLVAFGAGFGLANKPAHALRSVLDEGSQKLFDEKQAKKLAPPPPPKSIGEMMGIEGGTTGKEPRFERPKYERAADKKLREEAEARAKAAGL